MGLLSNLSGEQKKLLDLLQNEFPLIERPFLAIGERLRRSEGWVLTNVKTLIEGGLIREMSGVFDSRSLGHASTLVAMKLPEKKVDLAGELVSREPGVTHNYRREHELNLWFTLTAPSGTALRQTLGKLKKSVKPDKVLVLPALRVFKINVSFPMNRDGGKKATKKRAESRHKLTSNDRKLVKIFQKKVLPISKPFQESARELGMSERELLGIGRRLIRTGMMRRFGAVLRHRKAGFGANAMTVWRVPKRKIRDFGKIASSFQEVSHCYERPTAPGWHYSLFTMIHGRRKGQCEGVIKDIAEKTGVQDYEVLYSTREYKKERFRYFEKV